MPTHTQLCPPCWWELVSVRQSHPQCHVTHVSSSHSWGGNRGNQAATIETESCDFLTRLYSGVSSSVQLHPLISCRPRWYFTYLRTHHMRSAIKMRTNEKRGLVIHYIKALMCVCVVVCVSCRADVLLVLSDSLQFWSHSNTGGLHCTLLVLDLAGKKDFACRDQTTRCFRVFWQLIIWLSCLSSVRCVLTELMFSWLRLTRSISGVSIMAVPHPTSSLYWTWTEPEVNQLRLAALSATCLSVTLSFFLFMYCFLARMISVFRTLLKHKYFRSHSLESTLKSTSKVRMKTNSQLPVHLGN